MTIREIEGDLIVLCENGEFDAMAHGCNCFHAMGSGIAGQLARKYPEVPAADQRSVYGDRSKLGTFTMASVDIEPLASFFLVFNLYTQFGTRTYEGEDVFEYAAYETAINSIARIPTPFKLGLPKLGAGLAGGDWGRIRAITEEAFENSAVEATIVHWAG